jgi:hypothetical protein
MASQDYWILDASCGTSPLDPYCWHSAWAITGYCFSAAFVFGLSQIVTRRLMVGKASTQVVMHGSTSSKTFSVKRGRTRLIPELLTASFCLRGSWCFLKGMPGNQWACYNDSDLFPNDSHYGQPIYAMREMLGRFATLLYVCVSVDVWGGQEFGVRLCGALVTLVVLHL